MEEKILEALTKSSDPMTAGQLADITGLDRKEVDKGMKNLKADGRIASPRRCYWTVG